MTLKDLYLFAEQSDIEIMKISCPESSSMSLMLNDGTCYIGMDKQPLTEREERIRLGHELGHCIKGAFYNRYSRFNVVSKQELKADKWLAEQLVDKSELVTLLNKGYLTNIYEIAEYFDVTEDFARRACEIYNLT